MELVELHKKLRKHLEEQKKNWKSFIYAGDGFYQGFARIGIEGCRPTEERFKRYDIKEFLSKEKTALDIGSNCGFFSLFVSEYVKSIDGIEFNPFLVAIANDTKEFLNIKNATFHNSSFEDFKIDNKYNIIFSLANDSTIDRNTKFNFFEYVNKILGLLNSEGLLIFESQALDATDDKLFAPKFDYLKKNFDILVNKRVKSNYPYKVKDRIFLVLKKKK